MGFEEFRATVLTVLLEIGTARDAELHHVIASHGISVSPTAFSVGMMALIKTGLVLSVSVRSTGDTATGERIYWISSAGKKLLFSLMTPK